MKTLKSEQSRVLLSTMAPADRGLVCRTARGPGWSKRRLHPLHHRSRQSQQHGHVQPPQCEDIYVMSPDGTNPTRLTNGGGAPDDTAAYSSGGADWSHSKKLIAFQSNRVRSTYRRST